ncbi:hypothetical protein GQ54DRAFT_80241 [Martensiomyces pterosporus]|nr:hypothetical protein GQ54DRAFT_80241 [Martensiomyces pterosporus]
MTIIQMALCSCCTGCSSASQSPVPPMRKKGRVTWCTTAERVLVPAGQAQPHISPGYLLDISPICMRIIPRKAQVSPWFMTSDADAIFHPFKRMVAYIKMRILEHDCPRVLRFGKN